MTTNLLAQNDNLVIENLKADVGKSIEPLIHSVTFPIDVDGAIYPICCIETLPSDSFEISIECLLRQLSPMSVPVMTNLRLNTAFYYCDNRLAWKKWDRFMTGGRSGNEVYDVPRIANQKYTKSSNPDKYLLSDIGESNNIELKNSLHTYFGISMNVSTDSDDGYDDVSDYSEECPLAFPFFDYQMICRDYYTNVDRLPATCSTSSSFYDFDNLTSDWSYDNLFPADDDEFRLVDGIQIKSGWQDSNDSDTGIKGCVLDKIRYHEVRDDYFTSSKKAPMRGDAPQITGAGSTFTLSSGNQLQIENKNGLLLSNHEDSLHDSARFVKVQAFTSNDPHYHYSPNLQAYKSGTETSATAMLYDPDNYYQNAPIQANISEVTKLSGTLKNNVTLNGSSTLNLTVQELRLLSQLTVWQELNMLHKPYYNDFLNAHFDGVRVGESPVEKPIYIGGTSQLISINEILQTSASTAESPLGNQGATAMSLASSNVGKYYCNNYGYIIGVAYIIPDLLYKPAMPRMFSRRTKEDYYSPEFANLSMQATLNKEIFFSNDSDWNNAPWGYTGAFDELRSIPNRIAGDLLNPEYTDIQKWVLTRDMANDNKPSMSTSWLSLKGNVDKTAWAVPTMPAFMLQCANYIKAVRPMPKVAIPKSL